MKLAVLLATFNRKEKTLACLRNLSEQDIPEDLQIEVFLTDDASKDGTVEAVREQFPEVHIYHGTGQLFWSGGMRISWSNALKTKADYYLLLNDDTFLYEKAIRTLIQSHRDYYKKHSKHAVLVGSTIDPGSGKMTYGGRKLYSRRRPQGYLVQSETHPVECDLGNANIMLVPSAVVDRIGILSDKYTHGIADFDYTLRAKKAGFPAIVPPGIFGTCVNDHGKKWKSQNAKLSERVKYLYSVKGLAYNEYLAYIKNHFPLDLPASFVKLWLKTLLPVIYDTFKK